MDDEQTQSAVVAVKSAAIGLGLRVEGGHVLHSSNRLAAHVSPCEVLARVAPAG